MGKMIEIWTLFFYFDFMNVSSGRFLQFVNLTSRQQLVQFWTAIENWKAWPEHLILFQQKLHWTCSSNISETRDQKVKA